MKTNLAPRSCEPFAFAWLLGCTIFYIFEFIFRVTVFIWNFLYSIVLESATEHFARLNAGSTFC